RGTPGRSCGSAPGPRPRGRSAGRGNRGSRLAWPCDHPSPSQAAGSPLAGLGTSLSLFFPFSPRSPHPAVVKASTAISTADKIVRIASLQSGNAEGRPPGAVGLRNLSVRASARPGSRLGLRLGGGRGRGGLRAAAARGRFLVVAADDDG